VKNDRKKEGVTLLHVYALYMYVWYTVHLPLFTLLPFYDGCFLNQQAICCFEFRHG